MSEQAQRHKVEGKWGVLCEGVQGMSEQAQRHKVERKWGALFEGSPWHA